MKTRTQGVIFMIALIAMMSGVASCSKGDVVETLKEEISQPDKVIVEQDLTEKAGQAGKLFDKTSVLNVTEAQGVTKTAAKEYGGYIYLCGLSNDSSFVIGYKSNISNSDPNALKTTSATLITDYDAFYDIILEEDCRESWCTPAELEECMSSTDVGISIDPAGENGAFYINPVEEDFGMPDPPNNANPFLTTNDILLDAAMCVFCAANPTECSAATVANCVL